MTTANFLTGMLLFWAATGARHRAVNAFVGPSLIRHHAATARGTTTTTTKLARTSSSIRRTIVAGKKINNNNNNNWRLFSTAASSDLEDKIKVKGDEIRQLKADGIDKAALAPHIEELLALKAQLENENDNKPSLEELNKQIAAKGDEIRRMKADGVDKESLAPHIEELLALKARLPADEAAEKKPAPKKKGGKQKQKQKK
mmetsp:Transcript_3299/g.9146  ORF Transcript_3299/g.9146 Transcript_3299/m.9146 type:complete len:201 (-) Transcript_3299:1601-2203(-)